MPSLMLPQGGLDRCVVRRAFLKIRIFFLELQRHKVSDKQPREQRGQSYADDIEYRHKHDRHRDTRYAGGPRQTAIYFLQKFFHCRNIIGFEAASLYRTGKFNSIRFLRIGQLPTMKLDLSRRALIWLDIRAPASIVGFSRKMPNFLR